MTDVKKDAARQQVSEIKARLEELYLEIISSAHRLAKDSSRNTETVERLRREIEALEYAVTKGPPGKATVASLRF